MKDKAYDTLFQVEERLAWFIARRRLYAWLLKGLRGKKILDAGCGTGGDLLFLQRYGEAVGVDISEKALAYTRSRGNKVVRGDVNKLPFPDKSFDVVVAGDCIYHQWVDDEQAAREFYRVLKPRGMLLVNTAAFEFLRSKHDEAVMTKTRYTKKSVQDLLQGAGFRIEKAFYWNALIFPYRLIQVTLGWGDAEESDLQIGAMANTLWKMILWVEIVLLKMGIRFPFGTSILVGAVRK